MSSSLANNVKNVLSKVKSISESGPERLTVDKAFVPLFKNSYVSTESKTTYSPFDFSIASQRFANKVAKNKKAHLMKSSAFNAQEVNPLDFYIMPHLLSGYMSQSGSILHRDITGLEARKQKQMTKAIKRARAFGLLSSVAQDVSTFEKRGMSL